MNIGAVEATILTALVSGAILLISKIIERRTPSVEKEAESEDLWRKELWDVNRTLSADIKAREAELNETRKLLHEVEKQNSMLSYQNAQLTHEKAAWQIEREEMTQKIKSLERDVFDLTRKVVQLERVNEQQQGEREA